MAAPAQPEQPMAIADARTIETQPRVAAELLALGGVAEKQKEREEGYKPSKPEKEKAKA